jgi:hypothetical protein
MKIFHAFLGVVLAVVHAAATCSAEETFQSLAQRVPREANALVLIDVAGTLASPLAKAQGWDKKLEAAYVERPVFLPPEAKKLALGAELAPSDDFHAAWELGVMELAEPVTVRSIARSESGYVEEINGTMAAVTPVGAAFVDLGANVLAAIRPADRQFVSRWIAFARDSRESELSEYLQSVLPLVSDKVQVMLALDLTDVVSPTHVEEKLAAIKFPAGQKPDLAQMAKIVQKLRGANLRLAIGDKCQAQLQIDFDAAVAPLEPVAKPLVLQALASLGFNSEALEDWDVSLSTTAIRMHGQLNADGQRRVFSVIELPHADLSGGDAASGAPAASESEIRTASMNYFKSSQTLVDDLRKGIKDTKASSAWMERYSQRIDELPVLHVDEELLDYGDKLAETLRIMALSKRQAGIRAGVRASEGRGYYDGYGTDSFTRAAERSQATKEEMAGAYDTRVEGWKLIGDATADIRRKMTKKYGMEF